MCHDRSWKRLSDWSYNICSDRLMEDVSWPFREDVLWSIRENVWWPFMEKVFWLLKETVFWPFREHFFWSFKDFFFFFFPLRKKKLIKKLKCSNAHISVKQYDVCWYDLCVLICMSNVIMWYKTIWNELGHMRWWSCSNKYYYNINKSERLTKYKTIISHDIVLS